MLVRQSRSISDSLDPWQTRDLIDLEQLGKPRLPGSCTAWSFRELAAPTHLSMDRTARHSMDLLRAFGAPHERQVWLECGVKDWAKVAALVLAFFNSARATTLRCTSSGPSTKRSARPHP